MMMKRVLSILCLVVLMISFCPNTLAAGKLSAPVVTAPSAGAVLTGTSCKITWNKVSGADHYIVAVRDLTTDSLVVNRKTTSNRYYNVSGLTKGHDYRLAVGAVPAGESDTSSLIGWKEVLFSVKAQSKLSAPVVTAPSAGAVLTGTSCKITWNSVTDADYYVVAVRDLTTDRLVVDRKTTSNRYYNVSGLTKGHSYRLAVGAVPEGESDTSSLIGWKEVLFSVKGQSKLDAPVVTAPSAGAVLTDTSCKITWNSVTDADYYVVAVRDLNTDSLVVNRKTTSNRYYNVSGLTKGHSYRLAVGAVPAGESDTSSLIGWKEVTFSVKNNTSVTVKANKTTAKAGETVTFTVTTNADKVKLYVDGVTYDNDPWQTVSNGTVTYKRAFTSAGSNRSVTFRTSDGAVSNTVTINVTAKGTLAAAKITAPGTVNTGSDVKVSWEKVPNADQYTVRLVQSGKVLWQGKTAGLTVTIPKASLAKGSYSITVMATGADYNQSSASVSLTVNEPVRIAVKADRTKAKVGETVTFTITTNAPRVKLYADGKTYDEDRWITVSNGTATYKRAFTVSGSKRVITFRADDGTASNAVTINVTAKGKLDKPVISAPSKSTEGKVVEVSWKKVKNAETYTVSLQKSGKEIWKKSTKNLTVKILKSKLTKGRYTIVVTATGTDYEYSSASVSLTVTGGKIKLANILASTPNSKLTLCGTLNGKPDQGMYDSNYKTCHDFKAAEGTALFAPMDGHIECKQIAYKKNNKTPTLISYGNLIIFTSSDGKYIIVFGHLSSFAGVDTTRNWYTATERLRSSQVKKSQRCDAVRRSADVRRGELIGFTGNTGHSSGPHLHLEVYAVENGVKKKLYPCAFFRKGQIVYESESADPCNN